MVSVGEAASQDPHEHPHDVLTHEGRHHTTKTTTHANLHGILAFKALYRAALPVLSAGVTIDIENEKNLPFSITSLILSPASRRLIKTIFLRLTGIDYGSGVENRLLTTSLAQLPNLRTLGLRTDNLWPAEREWGFYTDEQVKEELVRSDGGLNIDLEMVYPEDDPLDLSLEPVNFSDIAAARPDICVFVDYSVRGCVDCGGTCGVWKQEVPDDPELARLSYKFYILCCCNDQETVSAVAVRKPGKRRWSFKFGPYTGLDGLVWE